jgi:hypothetical protein
LEKKRNAHKIFVDKPEKREFLGGPANKKIEYKKFRMWEYSLSKDNAPVT